MPCPSHRTRPVVNHLTGLTYHLTSLADVRTDPAALQRIAAICNEPAIYDWLFRTLLSGQPYPEAKALEWLQWARNGWQARTHFAFAVVDADGLLVAACDLKSADPIPEIGYWAGANYRGLMTNTVTALLQLGAEAGFRGFFARTRLGNARSQAVLRRAGFQPVPSGDPAFERFAISF